MSSSMYGMPMAVLLGSFVGQFSSWSLVSELMRCSAWYWRYVSLGFTVRQSIFRGARSAQFLAEFMVDNIQEIYS